MSIRYGVPIMAVAGLAWFGWDRWRSSHVHVEVVDTEGRQVPGAKFEFFEFDDSPYAASPTPAIGVHDLGQTARAMLSRDVLDHEALVRVTAPGYGIGYAHLAPGHDTNQIELGPPIEVAGRLLGPGSLPVIDARVQAFGGGRRGVLLAETTSDGDGRFSFCSISGSVSSVLLRVFKPGLGRGEQEWFIGETDSYDLDLQPTRTVTGAVVGGDGAALVDQEIRVFRLPGVMARTSAGGSFVLDHLPARIERAYLVVGTLAPGLTHRRAMIYPGSEDVFIEIYRASTVSGRVVDGNTGRGVAGAKVSHQHGPHGIEVAECDSSGRFTIHRVPPGVVEVSADTVIRRRTRGQGVNVAVSGSSGSKWTTTLVHGSTDLRLDPGQDLDGVVIRIY